MKIDDAYFGVCNLDFNGEISTWNLFDNLRVKWSVAKYVSMTPEERKLLSSEPYRFCFGDVWGRCEYEWIVNRWPYSEEDKVTDGKKVDVFQMYVEPNKDYLMEIVNKISVTSAKNYLREERKRYKK